MTQKINLSKSRYCRGYQCPKMLWLEKYKPEEAVSTANEAVLANGTRVGELAQGYFGDYSVVDFHENKNLMCEQTRELMASGAENICEASFATDGLYCAVDILRRNGDGWDIVEVKSSTHVSPIYLEDMAFQHYVLTRCGINVKSVSILYIDNLYVFHDSLDLQGLFRLEDHTMDCRAKADAVADTISAIRAFVDTDTEPEMDIGEQCCTPYECDFRGYCGRHLPSPSVFDISGLTTRKKYEFYHRGIVSFGDVAEKKPKLTARQLHQVEAEFYRTDDEIDVQEIRQFVDSIQYPVYHLDFETFQLAVPEYEGCKPYCQIPFQYSLHIQRADGTLEHREFLAKEGTDPRRALAERLCGDIPADAFCMAYNMSFEKSRLKELAEVFPDLSGHLLAIADNMRDLMEPFRKQHYYTRAMAGSYSIKYVLPALFPEDPELDYHSLEGIHKGDEAANAFATLAERTPEDIRRIRSNLLAYCGLDTYAMVKILEKLKAVSG